MNTLIADMHDEIKKRREQLKRARKAGLAASGRNYRDLAKRAKVTYSMAYKWMNAERTSVVCQTAFDALTRSR